ncbi:MAG: 4-alpha-glucanotransferase, partial [Flavobacteriales bacterium]
AEDLGSDMDEALKFRKKLDLPGMKVLQFGFGKNMISSEHLPHNYEHDNYAVYVGTHDNDTAVGWFSTLDKPSRKRLNAYFGYQINKTNVHLALNNLALASDAKIAILQLTDILGLGAEGRINTPGTVINNWTWRIKSDKLSNKIAKRLAKQTVIFGRS